MTKKPKPFHPAQRIELDYQRSTNNFLQKYLGRFNPSDSVDNILSYLRNLAANSDFLNKWSTRLATRMVTNTRNSNAKSWREAAAKSGRGKEIYQSLKTEIQGPLKIRMQELIQENADLIGSIPGKVANSITKEIADMTQRGMRPEAIAARLQKRIPQLTKNRVKLIARTESSKASTALTRVRSEGIGISAYIWSTSRDERVRKSHKNLDGVIIFWDIPPSPEALIGESSTLGHYHAGNCPNCRCVTLPVVTLDSISWPAKVYRFGRIERIGLAKFRQISGILK